MKKEEVFFVEQADGTWHKMHYPEGVEKKLKNAVFEGRYRTLTGNPRSWPEDAEMFFAKGSHGIPDMIFVEKILDEPTES